ncbi:Crp/Fnr family transcriptional regulator [Chromobacterium phragmitis]|uniref:Crp/Fnr family transcriptional regulator n=1 Tax=Chromobacterium phragmitis TaxID=2202141 RepID=A0A344UDV0_9NEIS|nr:Crp/Fnr family transcriptional regulator [Chromobacterium phragmitis]AXE32060.1 Crp/Fnr family transcriptional regulator [Chromobacterium phragmitis]AXE33448.1 Crp/Fnr family transcriptional regulator [Chromobacterium phragmitis]
MSRIDIIQHLRHQPLFQQLSPQQLASLEPHVRALQADKGQLLFQRGDDCDGMYVVVYGKVKLAIPSPQGVEKVVEIIHPGQSFAEAVMFLGKPCPVLAQLLEDSMLLHIGAAGIFQALAEDPGFARNMLAGISLRLHGMIRDVERYSVETALQRVIGYFLQQLDGAPDGEKTVLTLEANKNLIASRLNLTPETFSRVLQQLNKAGLVEVDGKSISLSNPAALADYGMAPPA